MKKLILDPPLSLPMSPDSRTSTSRFLEDVIDGLSREKKKLDSMYFYDKYGDALFQQIMKMPEYYLTGCELEIFGNKTAQIAEAIGVFGEPFDLIELGAGDATKSMVLLDYLIGHHVDFTYMPIDISANMLRHLGGRLADRFPNLAVEGLQGDYFEMLNRAGKQSTRKKVVLFLGSNVGNMEHDAAIRFCDSLRRNLQSGDVVLIGFDLQKDPEVILKAYDDPTGITAAFNLNLLKRINRELDGNFNVGQFRHYPTYDPGTGLCQSYLISLSDQKVRVGERNFNFQMHEAIHMEISRKYTPAEIDRMSAECGFSPITNIYDEKGWFIDVIWKAI